MKRNEHGFGLAEGLLILVILGLVGFVGWYVWNQNKSSVPTESTKSVAVSNKTSTETNEASPSSLFVSSATLKTVTKNGLTVSYPDNWDSTGEDYTRLSIGGETEGDIIPHGFGSPFGYRYKGDSSWEHVDGQGVKFDDEQPTPASVNVGGASSTIIVHGGDGGCGGSKIVFAYQSRLYSVSLPWECESDSGHGITVPAQDVTANIENIIKSIRVN